jgi:hypothetical protein
MIVVQHRRAVGTFINRQEAEQALKRLYCAGFPINHISVVSKEVALLEQLDEAIGNTRAKDQAQVGTAPCAMITGSILGAIGGCLASIGILAVPAVAPVLAVGATGTALAATLAGAGIGLAGGGLVSACTSGTTPDRAIESDRFFPEEYLVIVNGTDEEVHRAERLLGRL